MVIFRLNPLLKVTPEHSLHSRVKGSITHNSIITFSSNFKGRLTYVNVNYDFTILCKTVIFVYELC